MGTLYWQLNDCWPVVSWSSRDYYGNEKALHYFVKKEYSTLLVSPVVKDGKLMVYIVSDSLDDCKLSFHISLKDFEGKTFFDTTQIVDIPKNSSNSFVELLSDKLIEGKDSKQLVFNAQLTSGKKIFSQNNFYFSPVKDLLLQKPLITKSIQKTPEGYQITLSSNRLAKNVYLDSNLKGTFSDNFFDILPGEIRTISFNTNNKNSNFEETLKILTLADTY
jgi:beta-mannosidase